MKKAQILSLSGGKDSTATLLLMLEHGERPDEVIFCDTTVEFDEMYAHLDRLEKDTGITFTRLKQDQDFFFYLCKMPRSERSKGIKRLCNGYGWANPRGRWCTTLFKENASDRYLSAKYGKDGYCKVIGIALDEQQRVKQDLLDAGKVRYPLIEWGYTEEMALNLCKSKGYTWGGAVRQEKARFMLVLSAPKLGRFKSAA